MNIYKDSKIYRLVCNETGLVYYGSTTQQLYKRKHQHKLAYDKFVRTNCRKCTSVEIVKNNDFDIILVEKYPCESKEQLLSRERFYIENNECVNITVPTRTPKEYNTLYYQLNKDKLIETSKQYYEANKEDIKEHRKDYFKHYRENNKEQLQQKRREKYILVKDERNAKVTCECGCIIAQKHKSQHIKTKKHLDLINI